MTRIKKPLTETKIKPEIMETGTDISVKAEPDNTDTPSDTIDETLIEELPVIVGADEENSEEQPTSSAEQIETTAEDCEVLYGVVMETAHGIVGAKKGKGHRGLPEERRKAQGKLLHSICQKYGITIPTEFEVVIFGGALIADWKYMTVDADKNESTCTVEEEESE